MRFEVLADGIVIGWTDLERGDPPMGVAFGRMQPAPAYPDARSELGARLLQVRPNGGAALQPVGGIAIDDFTDELGPDALQVTVLGLGYPEYERLFPGHVRDYEARFK